MAQSEHIIKNYDMLLSHGETKTRKVALDIAEAAIQRAIPYHETLRLIQRTPESISIGERTIFLREIDHIYVVGVGKGAYPIAQALEEKLGDLIDEGIVLVKKGDTRRLKRIEIIESGHPLPDQAGIDGAKKILSILQKAGERDLIFAPITGGSSAMMNLPCGRITLEDLRKINDALLKSGASIGKMNAVRKHLCKMKGGHLVEYAKPAEIPPVLITKKELSIVGSRMNCYQFPKVMKWLEEGKIDAEKMISRKYSIDDIQQAFEETIVNGQDVVKTLIVFE